MFEKFIDLFARYDDAVIVIFSVWWLWAPFVLVKGAKSSWLNYIREYYKSELKWTVLELIVPRDLEMGPRAMELFLTNVHAQRNAPGSWKEKYVDGEVTKWYSFELVSLGGEVHLYMRIPADQRPAIEANFYAQYPSAQLLEVSDYINQLPDSYIEVENMGKNISFGTELVLMKDDAIPLRSYEHFVSDKDFENLDPVSSILEIFRRIEVGDAMFMQILARPADDAWQKEGAVLVQKMKKETIIIQNDDGTEGRIVRTPGETDTIEAIETNIGKPGFEVVIRYLLMDTKGQKSVGAGFAQRSIIGAFNQYASSLLNGFRHNFKVWTRVNWVYWPHLFPKRRSENRKARLWKYYRDRTIPDDGNLGNLLTSSFLNWDFSRKTFILSTDELATIYHPPSIAVLTGPILKRAESKTQGAPAGLPIFGADDEQAIMERFQKPKS